jgi:hypothetical protein
MKDLERYASTTIQPHIPSPNTDRATKEVIAQLRAQGTEPVVIVVSDPQKVESPPARRDMVIALVVVCLFFVAIFIVTIIAVASANAPIINPPAESNPDCLLFC